MATDFNRRVEADIKEIEKMETMMSEAEMEVVTILCNVIDTFPPEFFKEKSVDELNEHFGGEGDYAVTTKVKKYMEVFQDQQVITNAMIGIFAERATPEENKEMGMMLKGRKDAKEEEPESEIIKDFMDLQMLPPDFYSTYEKFLGYLPKVYPAAPEVSKALFMRIKKAFETQD